MSQKEKLLDEARQAATNMRRNILLMTHRAKGGHPGGCLSATDILRFFTNAL
jgi:transketolase